MSNRLAQRYARYGLLANLNLSAIEHLREGEKGLQLSEEDRKRLLRLQDLLRDSWEGAFINGEIDKSEPPNEPQTRHNLVSQEKVRRSARSSLDDAQIVEDALPSSYDSLEKFVAQAVPALGKVIDNGLEDVDDQFVEGPLTEFLERLASSNRTRSSSERRGRQHIPLA